MVLLLPTRRVSPLPLGRGREVMTYGRVRRPLRRQDIQFAVVRHLAEPVTGELQRPPHPALRATFSPRGEGFSLLG
jgi:hypothetical protein